MGVFDGLFKRKKEAEEKVKEEAELTELEKLCVDDPETFEALKNTMFLDPRKVGVSMEDALAKAKKMEEMGDNLKAAIWYRVAGGLAIYKGDVSEVTECFSKYAKLTGRELKILEIPGKAVEKAQENYKRFLEIK